jgi:hypothetical protein
MCRKKARFDGIDLSVFGFLLTAESAGAFCVITK